MSRQKYFLSKCCGPFLLLLFALFGLGIGEASAQSSLPPCPSDTSVWNRYIGTYTFFDGRKYVGEFRDDKCNGQGTFTYPNGEEAGIYVGEFRDGKRNGQGTYTWRSGWKFVGDWKDGKPNGQGTVTMPDGTKYVGEFPTSRRKERMPGKPSEAFDGYVGKWRDGKFNGRDGGF
jgi:hypothetical protein